MRVELPNVDRTEVTPRSPDPNPHAAEELTASKSFARSQTRLCRDKRRPRTRPQLCEEEPWLPQSQVAKRRLCMRTRTCPSLGAAWLGTVPVSNEGCSQIGGAPPLNVDRMTDALSVPFVYAAPVLHSVAWLQVILAEVRARLMIVPGPLLHPCVRVG